MHFQHSICYLPTGSGAAASFRSRPVAPRLPLSAFPSVSLPTCPAAVACSRAPCARLATCATCIARVVPVLLLGAVLFLGGCSGKKETIRRQAAQIDSLQAEGEDWRERALTYADSLQFADDVETGRYYRELRVLNDRLDRARYDITTLRDGGRTVAVLPADVLFEPASATLTEAGRVRLDTLAAQLQAAYPERPLRVEGHSDDLALSPELQQTWPSNWELSAARAGAVVRYLIDAHGLEASRFALGAYAATRPVAGNASAEGRRRNRRVRIAVLPPPRAYERPFESAW